MRSALLVGVVVAVGGCSSVVDSDFVAGTWRQDFGKVPGNFFEMTLYSTASGVAGTGYGCGEAGPCAVSNITGTVDGRAVHLTIISTENLPSGGSFTSSEQFDGFAFPGNMMSGKIHPGLNGEVGLVYDVVYRRGSSGDVYIDDKK